MTICAGGNANGLAGPLETEASPAVPGRARRASACACGGDARYSADVSDQALVDDVRSAAAGDYTAWSRLVERFSGLVWSIARAHGLDSVDAADVSQTTWLRLTEHIDRLREPDRVGAWLATTARRESLHARRGASRQVPVDFDFDLVPDDGADVEAGLLREERDSCLWRAFRALAPPCQTLLRVLMADPPPSYAEVSAALGMPVGSIGPCRARCLERLRASAWQIEVTGDSRRKVLS